MSLVEAIETQLNASSAVLTLATGGILTDVPDERRDPQVFDLDGRVKPCVAILEGTQVPFGPYATSSVQYLHVLCYAPYRKQATQLADAVFAALQDQILGNRHIAHFDDAEPVQDPAYKQFPAWYRRSRYRCVGLR